MKKEKASMTAAEDLKLWLLHKEGKTRHEIYQILRRSYELIKDSYKRQGLTPILPKKKRYDRERSVSLEIRRTRETPAEKTKIDYSNCSLPSVEIAAKDLSGRVSKREGAYYLDGKLVSVLRVLEEANALRLKKGQKLLGIHHSRWHQ